MTTEAVVDELGSVARQSWTSSRWPPWVMVIALLLLVVAPARIWLHAGIVSLDDPAVASEARLLWVTAGLTPAVIGIVAWFVLRGRPARQRFVGAALWASAIGLLTIVPITPYVYSV